MPITLHQNVCSQVLSDSSGHEGDYYFSQHFTQMVAVYICNHCIPGCIPGDHLTIMLQWVQGRTPTARHILCLTLHFFSDAWGTGRLDPRLLWSLFQWLVGFYQITDCSRLCQSKIIFPIIWTVKVNIWISFPVRYHHGVCNLVNKSYYKASGSRILSSTCILGLLVISKKKK
jgi:hypothetical protein